MSNYCKNCNHSSADNPYPYCLICGETYDPFPDQINNLISETTSNLTQTEDGPKPSLPGKKICGSIEDTSGSDNDQLIDSEVSTRLNLRGKGLSDYPDEDEFARILVFFRSLINLLYEQGALKSPFIRDVLLGRLSEIRDLRKEKLKKKKKKSKK